MQGASPSYTQRHLVTELPILPLRRSNNQIHVYSYVREACNYAREAKNLLFLLQRRPQEERLPYATLAEVRNGRDCLLRSLQRISRASLVSWLCQSLVNREVVGHKRRAKI